MKLAIIGLVVITEMADSILDIAIRPEIKLTDI